jgi:hypothetical protein
MTRIAASLRHMTSLTAPASFADATTAPRKPRPRPLLMGDIVSGRAGVPELLIQMARAEGRDDPPAS